MGHHGGQLIDMGYAGYLAFRDGFLSILDPRFYTPEWLDGQVWSGIIRVMAADDAAVLWKLRAYPTGLREIHFEAATGNLDTIMNVLRPAVEQAGRELKCSIASVESRTGWERLLRPEGYAKHQTILRKEI